MSLVSIVALGVAAVARAGVGELDAGSFDRRLSAGNFFNWVDFDAEDARVSWPLGNEEVRASGWTPYLVERIVHDDNLYRLPSQTVIPGTSRDDTVNTVTAGFDGRLSSARQSLELLVRADDNRYIQNSYLNNTSGSARASGQWALGSRVSGDLEATYDRLLGGFGNYVQVGSFGAKNLVTATGYLAGLHVDMGPNWSVSLNGRHTNISHSLNAFDKFSSDSGTAALEYHSGGQSLLRAEYGYLQGRYPVPVFLNGVAFDRDFRENFATLQMQYPVSGWVWLRAKGGYIDHRYPHAPERSFAGGTWEAALAAQPSGKTQLVVAALRQLHSYLDAQSEYFVSQGLRITASWAPTAKLSAEVELSHEDQKFIGPTPTAVSLIYPDHNLIRYGQLNLGWAVSRPVQVLLTYRFMNRGSNVPVFIYDDTTISAVVRARF
jgi:hypothetical protein